MVRMAELRTEVSFLSNAFNTTQTKETYINEQNYGDDLALAVMDRLRALGWQVAAEDDGSPGQEDHGWYFGFGREKPDHTFMVGHITDTSDEWLGWVERDAGFIASLFGGRQKGIQPEAAQAIHAALSGMPEIREIKWSSRGAEDSLPTPV
jgi:hypothetical protein